MAIAEAHLAAVFNKPGHPVIDHYTYAIVTDGDLMEGVASEAASLAGHLKLGKLIYLYDDNRISIDGSTDIAFTEDRAARFEAYGWHVQKVADGNDVAAVDAAIQAAKQDERPSLIVCRTHIGYGLPTRQDTPAAHGSPPGEEELNAQKKNWVGPLSRASSYPMTFWRISGRQWNEVRSRKMNGTLPSLLTKPISPKQPARWNLNWPENCPLIGTKTCPSSPLTPKEQQPASLQAPSLMPLPAVCPR